MTILDSSGHQTHSSIRSVDALVGPQIGVAHAHQVTKFMNGELPARDDTPYVAFGALPPICDLGDGPIAVVPTFTDVRGVHQLICLLCWSRDRIDLVPGRQERRGL